MVVLAARYLAGLHALRADIDTLHGAVDNRFHLLNVRVEHPVGHTVRVAHVAAGGRVLAAHAANLGHCHTPFTFIRIIRDPTNSSAKPGNTTTRKPGATRAQTFCEPDEQDSHHVARFGYTSPRLVVVVARAPICRFPSHE